MFYERNIAQSMTPCQLYKCIMEPHLPQFSYCPGRSWLYWLTPIWCCNLYFTQCSNFIGIGIIQHECMDIQTIFVVFCCVSTCMHVGIKTKFLPNNLILQVPSFSFLSIKNLCRIFQPLVDQILNIWSSPTNQPSCSISGCHRSANVPIKAG